MIEPTTDYDFIKSVSTIPSVWEWVTDVGEPAGYVPDKNMLYLKILDGEKSVGFFAINCINSILFEIHTVIHPDFWGKSLKYSKEVLEWIFSKTKCEKLITFVPENNQRAFVYAKKSGLTEECFIKNSWLKNNVMYGQYILSVSRGDICQ